LLIFSLRGFSNVFVAKSKKYKVIFISLLIVIAINEKIFKNLVAIKVLSEKFEKKSSKICSEISFLMTCNHPNIINHIESFLHNDKVYVSSF
jgi:serine/threonine protein kinase